jgi:hypothetical protein
VRIFMLTGRRSRKLSPESSTKSKLSNHRIHQRAGTLPSTNTVALEQANDTKDLNRVQRPLAAGGKLVGKLVNDPGTGICTRQYFGITLVRLVNSAFFVHRSSPGYQHVSLQQPLKLACSSEDRLCRSSGLPGIWLHRLKAN